MGRCLFLVVVLFTVSFQGAAREKPLFTGNSRLFNPSGDDNGLFSQDYRSGAVVSNQEQSEPTLFGPRVSSRKFFAEILLGILGNAAGGFTGVLIGGTAIKGDSEEIIPMGVVLGYFPGSVFGSALGVVIAGNSAEAKGSFGSALLGSLLGEGAAILVTIMTRNKYAAVISFIALPPIGAALFFNRSLKYRSLEVSHALFNFQKGEFKIGIPYVHIQPLPGCAKNIKPTVSFNVNLLNIVF